MDNKVFCFCSHFPLVWLHVNCIAIFMLLFLKFTVWKWKSQHKVGGTDHRKWGFEEQVYWQLFVSLEKYITVVGPVRSTLNTWFMVWIFYAGIMLHETCVIYSRIPLNIRLTVYIYVSKICQVNMPSNWFFIF